MSLFILGKTAHQTSQLVGRLGEHVTILCLADEQIQNVEWTGGTANNITFTQLNATDAGVYTCNGTTMSNGVVSHSVNITVSGELFYPSIKYLDTKLVHESLTTNFLANHTIMLEFMKLYPVL